MNWICVFCSLSHPAWVCGLKLDTGISLKNVICHTLRGCVDWNLATVRTFGRAAESHPAWVCGLKHVLYFQGNIFWSHTLRGCVDWNFGGHTEVYCNIVTPCVGVWIETLRSEMKEMINKSHPAWVCGLKLGSLRRIHYGRCHTLRGCVDWNNDEVNTCIDNHSHTLRGCIWIEALFTRWSSLWKNCKHSASCVFLFKLL